MKKKLQWTPMGVDGPANGLTSQQPELKGRRPIKKTIQTLCAILAILLGAILSGTVGPPAAASTKATATSCPDVVIYGARGSGEDNIPSNVGMGTVPYLVAEKIRSRLPSSLQVLEIGVNYPAPGPFSAVIGNSNGYLNSVSTGADVLVNGYNGQGGLGAEVVQCPNVKVVLIGISQGAHVIDYALSAAPKPTPVTQRIVAVLLFGDPVHQPYKGYNIGRVDGSGALLNFQLPGNNGPAEVPQHLWPVTQSYCLENDPICQFRPGNDNPDAFMSHRGIHDSYPRSDYPEQAAAFAVRSIVPPVQPPAPPVQPPTPPVQPPTPPVQPPAPPVQSPTYGPELLSNGGFEMGVNGYYWHKLANGSVTNFSVYCGEPGRAYEGNCFAETNSSEPSGAGSIYHDIPLATSPGQSYTLSCWVRSPTGVPISAVLALWDTGGPTHEAASQAVTAGGTWQQVSLNLVTTMHNPTLRAQVYLETAVSSLDIDACSVRQKLS